MLIAALTLLAIALILLAILAYIDAKTMLLPNHYVFLFGLTALAFHITTRFQAIDPVNMLIGALVGGGGLYLVRLIGNKVYKRESLGLGDVKLMLAGGLWLGGLGIIWAITAGAFITLVIAFFYASFQALKTGQFNFTRLVFPAGPGFCIGLATLMILSYGLILPAYVLMNQGAP